MPFKKLCFFLAGVVFTPRKGHTEQHCLSRILQEKAVEAILPSASWNASTKTDAFIGYHGYNPYIKLLTFRVADFSQTPIHLPSRRGRNPILTWVSDSSTGTVEGGYAINFTTFLGDSIWSFELSSCHDAWFQRVVVGLGRPFERWESFFWRCGWIFGWLEVWLFLNLNIE